MNTTQARRQVGAREPWKECVVDGVRLAYDDEGRGATLLCLHATGHGARDFEPLRERLRGRYRVIALDWPGQGSSGDDRVPASAARYAELLSGFVAALALDPLVLIGNSIGGAAALRFAAREPARVRALVLANPGGLDRGGNGLAVRLTTGAMAAFFAAGARGARWFPRAFAAYYRIVLRADAASAQRARIAASAYEIAPVLAQAWRSFGQPDADVRALAAKLACPVWFAWGEQDRVIQLSRNRAAIARVPNARLDTFPAGHAAFLECPDAFVAGLERFLAKALG